MKARAPGRPSIRPFLRRVRSIVGRSAKPSAPPPVAKPWLEDRVRERIAVGFRPSAVRGHRLNLLVPSVRSDLVFGGVQTALDLFEAVGAQSERRRIVSMGPLDAAAAGRLPDYRLSPADEDPEDARQLVSLGDPGATLPVGPGDVFVATFWTTADLALQIAPWQVETFGSSPGRFGYLIQDFEPGFYPWSANHLLALSTYRSAVLTIAVFNTELLRGYFHDVGLSFAHEFAFEPRLGDALRTVLARPHERPRQRRIVLYGRPRTPRNAFPLLAEALRAWRAREPEGSEWTVVSVGQSHPDVDLGGGATMTSMGKLDLETYGALLHDSAIGLSFMVSPHPSYPPLEMAHFGMLVLTNRFAAKDLSTWHSNITSVADASIEGVADALARLCRTFESDPAAGGRGVSSVPGYLGDAPQFPFAPQVAALLRTEGDPEPDITS